METVYVLFVNSDDPAAAREMVDVVSHKLETDSASKNKLSVLGHVVFTDKNGDLCQSAALATATWCSLQDLTATFETKASESAEGESSASVAQTIHHLADLLPYCGVPLHVVWNEPQLLPHSDSYLPTVGAVLHLVHWHNAQVTIVQPGEITADVHTLVDICKAKAVSNIQSLSICPKIWMGKISLTSKIDGHGIVFPGFCMSCEDNRLLYSLIAGECDDTHDRQFSFGRMLEVLDEIDVRTIPACLLSSLCVSIHFLHTKKLEGKHVRKPHFINCWVRLLLFLTVRQVGCDEPRSQEFVQYVNSLDEMALVARIAVYQTDSLPTCADRTLSTASWKEGVMADIANVQEPDEEILPGARFVHVLLLKHAHPDMGCLKGVLLTSPDHINTDAFRLTPAPPPRTSRTPDTRQDIDLRQFVLALPQLSDVFMQELQRSLVDLQTEELHELLATLHAGGDSTLPSTQQLRHHLGDIQEQLLTTVLMERPRVESSSALEHDQQEHSLPVLDFCVDRCDWPERLALQYLENQRRTLRRFQSTDSVALSSPLHPDDAGPLVDSSDLLRCFHPDGNAVHDKLSPVRQQSSVRVKKIPSGRDASLKWPDCKDCQYHDIYYNRDHRDEQQAKHYAKIRDKLQRHETRSFCSSNHKLGSGSAVVTGRNTRNGRQFSPSGKSDRRTRGSWNSDQINSRLECTGTTHTVPITTSTSCSLRRSPRKKAMPGLDTSRSVSVLPRPNKRKRSPDGPAEEVESCSPTQGPGQTSSDDQNSSKQSRSQRHKKKLEEIVTDVLLKHGVEKDVAIYRSCHMKLFQVTKFFVKALPNSRHLSQEMRHIAEGQVTQVSLTRNHDLAHQAVLAAVNITSALQSFYKHIAVDVVDLEKRRIEMKKAKKRKVKL